MKITQEVSPMKRSDVLQIMSVLWFIAASVQVPVSWAQIACTALFALCGVLSCVHLFWLERPPKT